MSENPLIRMKKLIESINRHTETLKRIDKKWKNKNDTNQHARLFTKK